MYIRTKAIFIDEETKEDKTINYSFDLFDITDSNESENGYTSITNSNNTRTTVLIKYETFWKLIKETYHKTREIIE